MKLALREDTTPGATLADQLAWLERVGFDGIELNAAALALPLPELRAIFAGSPIALASVDGSPKLAHPDPRERAAARELTLRRIEIAAALGALGAVGVLVVPQFGQAPLLPDLSPLATAADLERDLFVAHLRQLVPAATAAGVVLFLEPLIRYQAHLVNRLDQAVALADRVGPEVGVMADFFHMNVEEADIAAAIAAAGPRIVHVHVADSNRLQPGRGHLDFRPGFAALKAAGYDGFLGFEGRIDGPPEEALRGSAALLRELWTTA